MGTISWEHFHFNCISIYQNKDVHKNIQQTAVQSFLTNVFFILNSGGTGVLPSQIFNLQSIL